jgi:type IV pilus assembly protein PilF
MNHPLLTLCVAIFLAGCATGNSLSVSEKKADIYFNAGTEDLRAGRYTEALSSLLQAVKLISDSPSYWNNLGLAYGGKKEYTKAEESWKKALAVDSQFTDAKVNLGALYLNQKKLRESELLFREALKDLVYPSAAQIHYNLSLLYSQWKKAPLVEKHLQLAVRANDAFCPAWYQLAKIQKERGDFINAEKSFTKSVSGTCFNNPEVHYEISSLHLRNKEIVKAKAKLIEIIQLFPQSDWAKKAEITLNMIR